MGYSECPTESDDDMERAELEITKKFDLVKSSQLFTNTARVYMFSKRIFEDIPYHDCNPQMKLEICICYLHTEYPFSKELFSEYKDWMWELKQLSFALSGSNEDHDIQYSKIGDCLKKLTAKTPILKSLFMDCFFAVIIKNTPYSKKIKREELLKKQAGKNKDLNHREQLQLQSCNARIFCVFSATSVTIV